MTIRSVQHPVLLVFVILFEATSLLPFITWLKERQVETGEDRNEHKPELLRL